MHPSLLVTLFSIALVVDAHSEPDPIRVQHRVTHPNLPAAPWSALGVVALPPLHSVSPLGSHAALIPSDTFPDDIARFTQSIDTTVEGAMYQIALERPGAVDDVWPTSVVKACHLPGSTSAHLTIHFSPAGLPLAVDHFVSPTPHDGSCTLPDSHGPYPAQNITVTLMSARQPPRPELRTPPPLTADGEPMAPAPEKSFLQKYWIYIVVVLGVLLISGPAEEPAGNGGGQGGR